jgi:uncharacterized protein (DUF58 family)
MAFLDVYDLKQVENLDLLAKKVVEGFIIGLHKSPFHGFSVEFAEHRQYNQGESMRNMDWKVYARTDKLFVKKYEEETNLRCQVVVDTSSSMYFPRNLKVKNLLINKLQFSALAAASLINLLKRQRDAFGLSLFEDKLKIHTANRSSGTHYKLLMNYLEQSMDDNVLNKKSSTPEVLHEIADRIHKRSLVVLFSDLFDQEEKQDELFAALQHLNYNKHEVIIFHVYDKPFELNFDFTDRPHLFIDMETGEKIRLQSNEIRDLYREKIIARRELLVQKCLQYGIDYVPTDIREGFYTVLRNYLVKRSRIGR